MRRVSENLLDFAGFQVTRSGKKGCASCLRQNERQAVVSYCTEYLDTAQVPRLFYYIFNASMEPMLAVRTCDSPVRISIFLFLSGWSILRKLQNSHWG